MSEQTSFESSRSAISLPVSASGATPCDAQDGQTTYRFGQEAAPASLSVPPANKRASTTSATSGRSGTGSSRSAALQSSLESRLRARSTGSTLYRLTWKHRATPSQRQICALRASAARTSDSASTLPPLQGCPSPTVGNASGSQMAKDASPTGKRPDGSKATVSLPQVATFAGWPTPLAADARGRAGKAAHKNSELPNAVELAGWPTPTVSDTTRGSPETPEAKKARGANTGTSMIDAAHLAGWPTPSATNADKSVRSQEGAEKEAERKGWTNDLATAAMSVTGWPSPSTNDTTGAEQREQRAQRGAGGHMLRDCPEMIELSQPMRLCSDGTLLTGSTAGMASGGRLNPAHSRWLMRLPPEWDACAPTETRSTRKPRRSSSAQ